ncbi:uncharacterized protein METZ01_LOCUS263186, partial [marine metagenome]
MASWITLGLVPSPSTCLEETPSIARSQGLPRGNRCTVEGAALQI